MALNKNLSPDEVMMLLNEVNKDVINTKVLTENLLNWASKSMNEYNKSKEHIKLHETIEDKRNLFETSIENKKLELINNVSKDTIIWIDSNALELLLRNLISNAIKYCRDGDSISISSSIENNFTKICIQDTGIGMDLERAKTLFTERNLDSTLGTNNEKGSGIGLMLCRNFIVENGGDIWVESSEKGKGTKICFKVPVA
jgi:signal transduction histidine kinase